MDPQKLSQLDPKLRDAYQRVMGTVIPNPQTPAQTQTPAPPTPNPTPQPQSQPEPQPAPLVPEPIAEPQPSINPQQEAIPTPESIPAQSSSNFVQMNSEVPVAPSPAAASTPNFTAPAKPDLAPIQTQTIVIKKKNNILMTALIGIAVLIFIAVYSLFWTKIFNFKLPFLP